VPTSDDSIEHQATYKLLLPRKKRTYFVFFSVFFGWIAVSSIWDSIATGHPNYQVWGPGLVFAIVWTWLEKRHNFWFS
jgi:hypothetical protein